MNSIENDLIERLHAVAQRFEMPAASPADDVRRGRRRVRRHRGLWAGAAAATVAVMVGVAAVVSGQGTAGLDGLEPIDGPGVVVGDVPVWYDAQGLHRGDVVEQTPVEIGHVDRKDNTFSGVLALVRSGAVYLDPATGDVWFHPWRGEPRIIGHNSETGPGGDPDGDTAAWFEGSEVVGFELVVYDTAAGREISRTEYERWEALSGAANLGGAFYPPGGYFLQVSAARVVWSLYSNERVYSHDVLTQQTSVNKSSIVDVYDDASVFQDPGNWDLVLSLPSGVEMRYPALELTPEARFSHSGKYVLAVAANHDAAIVDTATGELWRVPRRIDRVWIAGWSYGDIALVDAEDIGSHRQRLLACDAANRSCERLPAESPFLMPTN